MRNDLAYEWSSPDTRARGLSNPVAPTISPLAQINDLEVLL